jgi:putative flippase GtrA
MKHNEFPVTMNHFSRFLVVGVLNTLLGYGVIFACMYLAGMAPETSNVAGYAVGLVASYVLNKNYTFNSRKKSSREIGRFLAVFGVAYAANLVMLFLLIHQIGISKGSSQIYAAVIYMCVSFIMTKHYVFTDSHTTE